MADDGQCSPVTRRRVIQGAAAVAALSSAPALAQKRPKPPNILFILADDLGYADLGCYGARAYETPALDRLATEGLLMTQGYLEIVGDNRVYFAIGPFSRRIVV